MAYDLSKLLERLPRDPELEAAQARDAEQGKWDRVSDSLSAAFTRTPYKATERGPGQAEQLTARRDSGLKRLTGAAQLDDIASKLDPESTAAKLYRPIVKSQYGKVGADVPAEVDVATSGDLAGISGALDKYENASKSKGKLAMDGVVAKQYAAEGKRLEEKAGIPPEQRTDWDAMAEKGPEKIGEFLKFKQAQFFEQGRVTRADANHDIQLEKLGQGTQRIGIAKEKLGMTQLHAAQEAQKSVSAKFAPDDPLKPFTPADVEAFAKQEAAVNTMKFSLADASAILKRNHGVMLPSSPDAKLFTAAMARALGNVVTAEGLGTMTEAHQELAHSLHTDPTSLWTWSERVFGREGVTQEQIDLMIQDAEQSISNVVAAHGGHRRRAGEKLEASPYAPKAGIEQARSNAGQVAKVRVQLGDGTTGSVDQAKLEGFLKRHPDAKVLP